MVTALCSVVVPRKVRKPSRKSLSIHDGAYKRVFRHVVRLRHSIDHAAATRRRVQRQPGELTAVHTRDAIISPAATSRDGSVVVVQHPAQALTLADRSASREVLAVRTDDPVLQTRVVAFPVVVRDVLMDRPPQRALAEKIIRSRQDSLMLRTNRSACAFRFGDRGGGFTGFTPAQAIMAKNSAVDSGSRS